MKRTALILATVFCLAWAECRGASVADNAALADGLAVAGARLAKVRSEQAEQTLYRALAYDSGCGLAYLELAKLAEKNGEKDSAAYLLQMAALSLKPGKEKSEADSRIRALNPLSGKLSAICSEYGRELEALAKRRADDGNLIAAIEARIFDLGKVLTELNQIRLYGSEVNLMPLLKGIPSALPSTYTRTPNGILSPSTGKIKIQIPYAPPEAYEFIVEYRRIDEGGSVGLLVPVKGVWQLWYQELERCGFPGIPDFKPPVAVHGGDKCILSMRVNGSHIDAFMNGRKLCSTDKPGQAYEWLLTNKLALGFGTQNCKVEFTSIRVVEMVGHGVVVR